ncbi:MAG: flagellar motor protein MotB [Zoogloeaceae bacterium]|jgi:chemotaxis protein MotB|nr:flagellar motor protein MotB [Zoogloeaceae bacterium]
MSDDSTRPIVIKRVRRSAGAGHGGGAWKIAYADFVTAMMAFFLLMWLLGSTAKGDLQGIADFFQNPLMLANAGGSGVGDATSIIQGGGEDLTRSSGQVREGDTEAQRRRLSMREKRLEFERRERQSLENLKQRIEKLIDDSPQLLQFKNQLLLDITTEGLRIQIVDEQNRPMFDLASDTLKPYTREILRQIGTLLNEVPNRLSLAGHTDAAQFMGGARGFSNWELSANRANASRRELVAGGMDDNRVLRVEGLAASVLFDPNDPLNPVNRRISIIVLNKRTEMGILENGPAYEELYEDEETASTQPTQPASSNPQ